VCSWYQPTPINGVCFTWLEGLSLARLKSWRRAAACGLLGANLLPALYTGLIHQRGTLDVMSHLQKLCGLHGNATSTVPEVLFLMPCHSTPFYRYRPSLHSLGYNLLNAVKTTAFSMLYQRHHGRFHHVRHIYLFSKAD